MDESALELAGMIKRLRRELQDAMQDGAGAELRFGLREVHLELQVVIESDKNAKGGVKFWVVNVGGGARSAEKTVHTVKLTLEPKLADGSSADIAGKTDQLPT